MNTSRAAVPLTPPASVGFSAKQWGELASLLAAQDIVLVPPGQDASAPAGAAGDDDELAHRRASALALASHWASMGFALTRQGALDLAQSDPAVHAWLHKHVTPALKQRLGGHVRLKPMYPNFPQQVMDMSDADLLFNALIHYSGQAFNLNLLPIAPAKLRERLPEGQGQQRVLDLVGLDGLRTALSRLVSMNTVWTPAQSKLAVHALPLMLEWGLVGKDVAIAQRENAAHMAGAWLAGVRDKTIVAGPWPFARPSTTDILRACVAYSGGDPSLASSSEKVRFAKLSRPQRRIIMQALEQAVSGSSNPLEDLHRHRQSWLRLGECLHAGEWKAMPAAVAAITQLRNDPAPPSWAAVLDQMLAGEPTHDNVRKVTSHMASNPGFAARALRRLLGWADTRQDMIQEAFARLAPQVDTPVLLSVDASLRADADNPKRERVMLPKGLAAWRYRVEGSDAPLPPAVCASASATACAALAKRFSDLPTLGKVFIEPGLEHVIVPKGLRSASDSVGVVARGSELPVGDAARIVRLFLWWKDTDEGTVDIDLSAVGLDAKFKSVETCNFQGLKGKGMTHSGDLVCAPEGAAEFVDVRMDALNKRTRYVVLTANVFRGPKFSELPECFVGWQERVDGQKGKIHEISTVVEKFQVTSPSRGFLAAAFDVLERRLVWLDLPLSTLGGRSIYDSHDGIGKIVEDFRLYAASQPKVADLVDLHVAARGGVVVDSPEKADVVFSMATRQPAGAQEIIAATQPLQVASSLLPSVRSNAASAQAVLLEQQENELAGLATARVHAKVPRAP